MSPSRALPSILAALALVLACASPARAAAPVATALPVVSGEYRVGLTLTTTTGTWTPASGVTFQPSWQRCDLAGENCETISAANSLTYRLTADDLGTTIRSRVRASNIDGSTYSSSVETPEITAAAPPANDTLPDIGGTATEGSTLNAADGAWSGPGTITKTRKWLRCDIALVTCTPITSATAATYKLVVADIGSVIRLEVTAASPDGATVAHSAPTAPVAGVAPAASPGPTLTGAARDGQVLKIATDGTWTGTKPQTAAYSWERCAADGSPPCTPIAGAAGKQYTLTGSDIGATVRGVVTMTNVAASTSAPTPVSDTVEPKAPPVNTVAPSITGTATEGSTLTAGDGTWTGPGTITKTRKWIRCDVALVTCAPITGATAGTYKLAVADIGSVVRLEVTATSPDGATTLTTAPTPTVAGVAPDNTVAPTLTGDARDGQLLKIATDGTWTGTKPQTAAYRWERCVGADPCVTIADQTAKEYTLTATDVGARVRGVVTMTNVTAATSATTASSDVVGAKQPPVVSVAPAITGTAVDGQTLSVGNGTWTGVSPFTYTRVWQRCDATGADCADMPVTAATYKLVAGDVGSTFRVRVTAKNEDGQTDATTAASAVAAPALPSNTAAPVVSGTYKDGAVVSATNGTWTGTPTFTYAYQWQRCAPACADIPGASASTYRLELDDVGATVRAIVRATNAAGTTSATSGASGTVTAGPPVNVDVPAISGPLARDGQTWTSTVGDWKGTLPQTHERHWQRCSATGTACVAISGEIGADYTMGGADVGKTIRMEITALSAQGTTKAYSAVSPVVVAARPELADAVGISGELRDGMTVTATGTWTGTAPITYTYQWQRCTLGCLDIPGATSQSYALVTADVGAKLKVKVGALNAGGGGNGESLETATTVLPVAPVKTGDPTLSGTAREHATLTTTLGSFSGSEPLVRTVEWQRCSSAGDACSVIPSETDTSLVLQEGWRGSTIRARVTATNAEGSASGTTAASAVIALTAPVNTVAPAVSPSTGLKDGVLLTTTDGGWTGSQPMTFAYKWQRCNASGGACVDIAGAAASTYRAATVDVGSTIRSIVTATNGADSTAKASLVTGVVGSDPPANAVLPTLSIDGGGATLDGATLRVSEGTWTGLVPRTPSYTWERCEADGESCSQIPDQTANTYKLTPAEVGLTVRARVTMSSAGGQTGVLTAPSAVVLAAPPVNLTRPVVTGAAAVGKTLTASPGAWSGTPEIVYTYEWSRCAIDDPSSCSVIAGETAATYRLTEDDNDLSVKVRVTGTNAIGTDSAESLTTAEIQDEPPSKVTDPSISIGGLLAVGATLTGDPGVWGGAQPIEYGYQWRRCETSLTGCADIAGATEETYTLTKDDLGKRVIFVVTATNVVDVATAQSLPTGTVLPEPPSNTVLPSIGATGGVRDGAKLTANMGNWKGATPITYDVEWLRCAADGTGCAPINGAVATTYTLTSDDVDSRIRVRVTAKNTASELAAESAPTAVVGAALPASDARPTVIVLDGKPVVGGRLRGVVGTWKGTNPMDLSLKWQRCLGASSAACDDIPGATSGDYVLTPADVGMRIRILVTAVNAAGTTTADATPTAAVPAIPPGTVDVPTIAGTPREGQTLSSTPGVWSGSQPITLAYQWERCKEAGATSCAKISGAVEPTYRLTSAEVATYVRVSVTAVNAGGKVTKSSVPSSAVAGIAPSNVAAPVATMKGTVKVGTTVSVTNGTWAGTEKIKYEVRWQSCNKAGTACADLDGGNKTTYKLVAGDLKGTALAKPLRAVVMASNMAGTGEAPSNVISATGASVDDDATAATAKKKKTAKKKATIPAKLKNVKSLAQIKKITLTSRGVLQIKMTCAKKSKTTCGITGKVSMKGLVVDVSAGPIKKGKSATLKKKLTPAQLKAFKGKKRVNLRVRIAAPGTPNLAKLMKKKVAVPKKISGKVKASKKKKSSKKKASKKKSASKKSAKK